MLGRTTGAVLHGVDARLVEVEVDLGGGLPTIAAVGRPDGAVREGIDRIRAALRHAGFRLPEGRITINLAPAEERKQGSGLDLPIAVALLLVSGQVDTFDTGSAVLAGELGLDGAVRPTRGALSIAMRAREAGRRTLLVSPGNAEEASLVGELEVVPISTLADVQAYATGQLGCCPRVDAVELLSRASTESPDLDLADVRGQASARRAIEIAAAGGHHLLLFGPPGAGKTMLARRLPGILPPLSVEEALEVTRVWSAAGLAQGLVTRRPFRAPHHAVSFAGLTGGGLRLRPGEISLATHGVLYLDELSEFRRDALEALRQPLEEGTITVVRLHGTARFPAAFSLVASMNPCRCGWYGSPDGRCECTPLELRNYRSKLSGPLLDRFDLIVEAPRVDPGLLTAVRPSESSSVVRERVVAARRRQQRRAGPNARLSATELRRCAVLDGRAERLLAAASRQLGITARGFDRVRRVARTLADLDAVVAIHERHVAEALQYRPPAELGRG